MTNNVRVLKMHDENLFDLYAGLAMLGMVAADRYRSAPDHVARAAFNLAQALMDERKLRKEQPVNGTK